MCKSKFTESQIVVILKELAGNRVTQTDARGVDSTYTYDALNQLITIVYPTASLNVSFIYDQSNLITGCTGSFLTGRLTRIIDSSGSTTYCYDRRGNVTRKTQVTAAQTQVVSYTWTKADRLASITYPSGGIATYGRNATGQITSIVWKGGILELPVTLVSNASYYPFGPLNVLTWGNGRGERFFTREQARAHVFEYIEVDYNRNRLHSTLGYLSPKQFEQANAA